MVAFWRVLAVAGSAMLLVAANRAPFDGDFSAWLSEPVAMVPAPVEAPALVEDEVALAEAAVEAPEVRYYERPANLSALVADVRDDAMPSDAEFQCLARSVYWEAKGEPLEGQLAIAQVILNRVERGRFGTDVCSVVKARGQFSFVKGGTIPAPVHAGAWATAQAVALIALLEAWEPVVGEATHFHARRFNPGWRMQRVAQVGNHIFYR
jgi:spore germination cell wall hydrolase CwlJ-like protein